MYKSPKFKTIFSKSLKLSQKLLNELYPSRCSFEYIFYAVLQFKNMNFQKKYWKQENFDISSAVERGFLETLVDLFTEGDPGAYYVHRYYYYYY